MGLLYSVMWYFIVLYRNGVALAQTPAYHLIPLVSLIPTHILFFQYNIYNNKRLVDLFYQSYFFGPSLLCSLDLFLRGLAQPIAQAARRKVKNFGQMLFGLLFNFSSNNEEPSLIFRKVGLFLERSQYIQWFEKQSHLPSLIFRKVGIKLERD